MDLAAETVQTQLEKILSSACFSRTIRLKDLLRYVVYESLANRGQRLTAYSLAIDVFGRDERFNPQTDTIVRVQTKHLRERMEHYYLTEGANDPIVISIPKGTYTPRYDHHGSSVQEVPAVLTPDHHATAREMLETVLSSRPDYSDGWALLAWVYTDEYRFDYTREHTSERPLDLAPKATKQAVDLDPDNGIAWFWPFCCKQQVVDPQSLIQTERP